MTRLARPLANLAAIVALASPGYLVSPASAAATPPPEAILGPLAIEPASGNLLTYMKVTTAGGCPGGTNSITRVFGKGFPPGGENVIGNTEVIDFGNPAANRMVAPLTITIEEARLKMPPGTTLEGVYELKLNCQEPLPFEYDQLYGLYVGKLRIAADGTYTALTTAADLPATPAPKTGAAALALSSRPQVNQEAAALSAAQAAAQDLQAVSAGTSADDPLWVPLVGGGAGLALVAAGGLLLRRRAQRSHRSGATT